MSEVKASAQHGFKKIIVIECPYCHKTHTHNYPIGEVKRIAECLMGEYTLDFEEEKEKQEQ